MPRMGAPARGNPPNIPPESPATPAGTAPRPVPDNAVAAGLIAGTAAPQLCGTDNAPIDAARPVPADTAAPSPVNPVDPIALEPSPAVRPDARPPARPDPEAALLAAPRAGASDFIWFRFDRSPAEIYPTELVIDKPVLRELRDDVDDVAVADDRGEASPCSAVGTVEVTCDSAAWVFVAAEVPVACATAIPCAASAVGLAVWGGGVNGVSVAAAADEPA